MRQDLERKIEETLNSLDQLKRAEANPFLAAKVRHRLISRQGSSILPTQWSWRLVMVMILFVVLNILTVRSVAKDKQDVSGASAVASDYSISLPQAY